MTIHQYPPNQADAIILVTFPTAYAPVTIFNDAIRHTDFKKNSVKVNREFGDLGIALKKTFLLQF